MAANTCSTHSRRTLVAAPQDRPYIGRFAPSPSGPLHFGSLLAALASYLDARHHRGRWLVRIEDVDGNRTVAGADRDILVTLERFGLFWDGEVIYQSKRHEQYREILHQLNSQSVLFACECTRRALKESARSGPAGIIYPGHCRAKRLAHRPGRALRVRFDDFQAAITDRIQGSLQLDADEIGDFIVRRSDGFFAYQLAVVVDDIAQGVTQVVRGRDLIASCPHQLYLYRLLQQRPPGYAHLPLVVDKRGAKLSKSRNADRIRGDAPGKTLQRALRLLGQTAIADSLDPESLLQQAAQNWNIASIPPTLPPQNPS